MGWFGSSKPFRFRFYVAGESERTDQILQTIKSVLDEKLGDQYDIETINVFFKDKTAKTDGIYVTPSFAKVFPLPFKKIFGSLWDPDELKKALAFLDEEKAKQQQSQQPPQAPPSLN